MKQLNVSVTDGDAFFAHEASINFSPLQFILDFRCVTPRMDIRDREKASLNIKHNVIMLDPFHAKRTAELMARVVADYEKKFGKIVRPKALGRVEKMEKVQEPAEVKQSAPNYFG